MSMNPLTNEQLKEQAPSLFTQEPHHEVSEKYHFIPTIDVIEQIRTYGWYPVSVSEAGVRDMNKKLSTTLGSFHLQYNKVPNTKGSKLVIQQMRLAILKYIPNDRERRSRQTRLLTTRDFNNLLLQRVNQTTVKKNPAKESCLKYYLLAYLNNIDGFDTKSKNNNKNGEHITKHKNIIIINRLASFGQIKVNSTILKEINLYIKL